MAMRIAARLRPPCWPSSRRQRGCGETPGGRGCCRPEPVRCLRCCARTAGSSPSSPAAWAGRAGPTSLSCLSLRCPSSRQAVREAVIGNGPLGAAYPGPGQVAYLAASRCRGPAFSSSTSAPLCADPRCSISPAPAGGVHNLNGRRARRRLHRPHIWRHPPRLRPALHPSAQILHRLRTNPQVRKP
jgi:hypothetical protein